MSLIPTQQVNGGAFPAESVTGTLDFWSFSTTLNISPSLTNNIFAQSQESLNSLIQQFSMTGQPVLFGGIATSTVSSGYNYAMGGAALVADIYQGVITAIEVIQAGTGFTAVPTVDVSTFASAGSGASATAQMAVVSAVVGSSGGTSYKVGDVVSVNGGTAVTTATLTVTAVAGGVITAVSITNPGLYTALPTLTNNTVTGGSGSSAEITIAFGVGAIVVSAGGSGYVAPMIVGLTSGSVSGSIPLYTLIIAQEHDLATSVAAFQPALFANDWVYGWIYSSSTTTYNNFALTSFATLYSSAYPGFANLGTVSISGAL